MNEKAAALLKLLKELKAEGKDARIVLDNPKGTLSFQGCINYEQEETTDES